MSKRISDITQAKARAYAKVQRYLHTHTPQTHCKHTYSHTYTHTHAYTHKHTLAHTHAHTHAHARTHTHTHAYNMHLFT